MDLARLLKSHLDSRNQQESTKNVNDPMEFLDQRHAGDYEKSPHDQRAENAPK